MIYFGKLHAPGKGAFSFFRPAFLTLALLGSLLFSSCTESDKPLRIGFVGNLTGTRSELGVTARDAVQFCVDRLNQAGGVKGKRVELMVANNRGDVSRCGAVLDEMIDGGVRFVVGPLISQMAEVTIEATAGRDVLLMSPSMSTDLLAGRDDNIFRFASSTVVQSRLLADFGLGRGQRKLGVVYDLSNGKYTEPLYRQFEERLQSMGLAVRLAEPIRGDGSVDMLALAEKIHGTDLDGLVLCLSSLDAANLAQQLRKLGSKLQLYGVSWTQTNDLIQHGGKAVEGMCLISIFRNPDKSPALLEFESLFEERYRKPPSFIGVLAWDTVTVLFEAMARAEALSPASVKSSLLSIGTFRGLDSTIAFDAYGDVNGQYAMTRVAGGAYVPLASH